MGIIRIVPIVPESLNEINSLDGYEKLDEEQIDRLTRQGNFIDLSSFRLYLFDEKNPTSEMNKIYIYSDSLGNNKNFQNELFTLRIYNSNHFYYPPKIITVEDILNFYSNQTIYDKSRIIYFFDSIGLSPNTF